MLNGLLRTQLTHRARISRSRTVNVNGTPQLVWETVAEDVPCLLDATDTPQVTAVAAAAQTTEADKNGRLLAMPEADLRPNDRVTITGLGVISPSTYTVQAYPSPVWTPQGMSHREFRVKES